MELLQHTVLFIREIPHSSHVNIQQLLYGKHREQSRIVFCKINPCESIVLAGKVMAIFLFALLDNLKFLLQISTVIF